MPINKSQLNEFLEDEDENVYGISLVSQKNENSVVLAILEEFNFELSLNGDGKYAVSSQEELLDEWVKEVQKYLDQGEKNLDDVLSKITDVYQKVVDEEVALDDDDGADGLSSDDELELDPDILGTDDPFAPISSTTEKDQNKDNDFNQQEIDDAKKRFNLKNAPAAAVNRLMKDYLVLTKQDTSQYGFSALPMDNDLFHWEIRLFGFDSKDPIDQDLQKYNQTQGLDHIEMDMTFPPEYPFKPPFIRVVRPRLQFHTGHVTIGGSICMELLTPSGWMPSNSIESILIQIRMQLVVGKGRIDFNNTAPYTEQEAQQAFIRVAQYHKWM
mmetsp:Transcript_5643/g.21248  ORF Transcript_5643/g.21248 Transcript_5643/m.21248 type:complete len:328 (-) Transcript_5643:278-1261(-)